MNLYCNSGYNLAMPTVIYSHIEITPAGVPIVAGTTTKVVEIAVDRIAYNWDADEIQRQHPTLTLGQIHGALAYYYDHQEEMDRIIAERLDRADKIIAGLGTSALRTRLQALKSARSMP
jgi:uncharacterized protein (DUF433 family)